MTTPTDDLDVPATRRDVLAVLAVVDPVAWERFTLEWRQEARGKAATPTDEQPTREDR